MQVLDEIRFNDNRILLKDNLVKSPILPKISRDLERDVVVQGDCEVQGAVFARNLEVQQGPLRVKGCAYTQVELHVNTDATGTVVFEKAVGSSNAIVSLAPGCQVHFLADVSAKQVKLRNAYVAANIFADEIVLDNCVVIGGVFATRSLELSDCVVGTFNSPVVRVSKSVFLLFPSAFSVERISYLPGTELFSITLADLGALMRGTPEAENTGKIRMNIEHDEVKTVLSADGVQQILRSYSVVGKVLATGLLDYDRLQNQFLISCASMGNQLLRTYDLGLGVDGAPVELTPERISEFFFDILLGKIQVSLISGEFDLASIVSNFSQIASASTPSATGAGSAVPKEQEPSRTPMHEVVASTTPPSTINPLADAVENQEPQTKSAADGPTAQLGSTDAPQEGQTETIEPSKVFCSACGAEVEEGSPFCGDCGISLA
jgi:hypothetical protein